jgi:hypothetical protein
LSASLVSAVSWLGFGNFTLKVMNKFPLEMESLKNGMPLPLTVMTSPGEMTSPLVLDTSKSLPSKNGILKVKPCGYSELTEQGLLEGDLFLDEQVRALSGEGLVLLDVDFDVQVSGQGVWDLVALADELHDVLLRSAHINGHSLLLRHLLEPLRATLLTSVRLLHRLKKLKFINPNKTKFNKITKI